MQFPFQFFVELHSDNILGRVLNFSGKNGGTHVARNAVVNFDPKNGVK